MTSHHPKRSSPPFVMPDFVAESVEKMKASIRAKLEHPFRVLKGLFGFTKVRYRSLAKYTARIVTVFALVEPCQDASPRARSARALRLVCARQKCIAKRAMRIGL